MAHIYDFSLSLAWEQGKDHPWFFCSGAYLCLSLSFIRLYVVETTNLLRFSVHKNGALFVQDHGWWS